VTFLVIELGAFRTESVIEKMQLSIWLLANITRGWLLKVFWTGRCLACKNCLLGLLCLYDQRGCSQLTVCTLSMDAFCLPIDPTTLLMNFRNQTFEAIVLANQRWILRNLLQNAETDF
jgi:hypothetical protein